MGLNSSGTKDVGSKVDSIVVFCGALEHLLTFTLHRTVLLLLAVAHWLCWALCSAIPMHQLNATITRTRTAEQVLVFWSRAEMLWASRQT